MVCPNFSVDCLETLYDVPYELEPLYRAVLSGQKVNADEEPGALENTGKAASHCDDAHAGDFRRGAHRQRSDDEAFIYVPCLNRSKGPPEGFTHRRARPLRGRWGIGVPERRDAGNPSNSRRKKEEGGEASC